MSVTAEHRPPHNTFSVQLLGWGAVPMHSPPHPHLQVYLGLGCHPLPSLSPLHTCSPYSAIPHPHLQVYLGLGRTLSHAYPPSALVQYSLASASIHHPHLLINLCLGRTLHAVKLDEDAHSLLLLVPRGGHLIGRE